ncbi:hypothetical protein [Roseomonas xinghualingensis]|uniref:hypothetical protein n=1 Tax=Roseomonas xinghualingensis TaxID=2986475 RepID=UPI0021F0A67A|nr:hypothetical protein [Roseomonas sp. SXEYE001]MCV4206911.1 hypothetical protein [Roseomonas sp. SXEYE001]
MMPHAVLSRRGAFGLAALLSLVRPAPAGGSQAYAREIAGELLEIRCFGEGICLDAQGGEPIQGEMIHCVRTGNVMAPLPPEVAAKGQVAPCGWDTLENVR